MAFVAATASQLRIEFQTLELRWNAWREWWTRDTTREWRLTQRTSFTVEYYIWVDKNTRYCNCMVTISLHVCGFACILRQCIGGRKPPNITPWFRTTMYTQNHTQRNGDHQLQYLVFLSTRLVYAIFWLHFAHGKLKCQTKLLLHEVPYLKSDLWTTSTLPQTINNQKNSSLFNAWYQVQHTVPPSSAEMR